MANLDPKKCIVCGCEYKPRAYNSTICGKEACRIQRRREADKVRKRKEFPKKEPKPKRYGEPLMALHEKEKLCKSAGISYGEMQLICASSSSKEQIIAKVEEIKRKKFLEASAKNADGTRIHRNHGGYYGKSK